MYEYKMGTGYKRVNELEGGKGYWILLNDEQDYILEGVFIDVYRKIMTQSGWDMIGSCSSSARVSTDACDIRAIYKYEQGLGYKRVINAETLTPGSGFWILLDNIDSECELIAKGVK